jgi:hypothetical protein
MRIWCHAPAPAGGVFGEKAHARIFLFLKKFSSKRASFQAKKIRIAEIFFGEHFLPERIYLVF